MVKTSFEHKIYLHKTSIPFVAYMIKFRTHIHPLLVELGNWELIPITEC